jgi:predicted N-acetyltransferase YhbS
MRAMTDYLPEDPDAHGRDIERLFHATFGPGHFAKTAERVREYSVSIPNVSRVGILEGKLIAVCRVWPLRIGDTDALFYGPIAVAPEYQGGKIGQEVTEASLQAGADEGHEWACLIGAPPYFGRMGFEVVPVGSLIFPGPQDQARVMLRRLAAPEDTPFPTGAVSAPLDARQAEATQRAYLQGARKAG